MKRREYNNVPFPQVFLDRVDAFIRTPTAKRLGITSRPDFFIRAGTVVLTKYDAAFHELVRLFDISEQDLKDSQDT